jgi:ABC-type Fe3+-hydroxamate transport system substrate-binding protein
MPVYFDQTGRPVTIKKTPERIISLVPSQTELLADLGLGDEVVGITKFCIHPQAWLRSKQRVGGTRQVKMDIIHQLQPDLILANKEENVKEQIGELEKKYPVWVSDVSNLDEAYEMINQVGKITGKENNAQDLNSCISKEFSTLYDRTDRLSAAYIIWNNPLMTIGCDTFIHSMLEAAGFNNVFSARSRYPETSIAELQILDPKLLFLSSEPFPFKQKHVDELQKDLPGTKIYLADGEMFSWYGSHLQYAPAYFNRLYEQVK